jgi:hypothetical protein
MLARLTLLLIALPALALAADVGGDRTRAAASPTSKPTVPSAATTRPIALLSPPPADPAQCRMGCAQTYYFCRAGDHPDDCAGTWGQCVASCNSPNLAPGYSTGP